MIGIYRIIGVKELEYYNCIQLYISFRAGKKINKKIYYKFNF